jgi:hypothetical protein
VTDRPQGEIVMFDYGSPAELFSAKSKSGRRQRIGYRRFATASSEWENIEVTQRQSLTSSLFPTRQRP